MARIVWLDQARDDLRSIRRGIAAHNRMAARAYTGEILDAVKILRQFPEGGAPWDEMYRTLAIRNHLLFYRYSADTGKVTIVTIIDGRRDLESILGPATAKRSYPLSGEKE